jgi:hypothetical protein
LSDRSHRPTYQPRQLAAEVEAQLVEMRWAHPRWGPRRLLRPGMAIGSATGYQLPMPTKQRRGRDREDRPMLPRQQPRERG